jgi:hypothetical protein
MKTLILALSVSILLPAFTQAGDDVVPLEKVSKGNNLYRIVPRGTMIPNNRGGANSTSGYSGSFSRTGGEVNFKPTQHYYTKDATISYRYSEDRRASGSRNYLGPNASYYNPHREGLAPNVSIRNLAHVEPARQPGVPMRSRRWNEANINNFDSDTYYRRADAQKYYHGGNVEPSGRGTSIQPIESTERASR